MVDTNLPAKTVSSLINVNVQNGIYERNDTMSESSVPQLEEIEAMFVQCAHGMTTSHEPLAEAEGLVPAFTHRSDSIQIDYRTKQ